MKVLNKLNVLLLFIFLLFVSSCMTGSWVDSSLPQTGNSGKIEEKYLSGGVQDQNPTVYKRHLTRGYYSAEDTVRVFYLSEAYTRDFNLSHSENSICFEMEINSSSESAGEREQWVGSLKEIKTQKETPLIFKFSEKYIQRDRGGWFQFYGWICPKEVLNPRNGYEMILEPKYRLNKKIILKWTY